MPEAWAVPCLDDEPNRARARVSAVWLGDVVSALVCGIYPHPHHRPRRGVAEPLLRRYPPGSWFGCLSVAAPLFDRTPSCGCLSGELRKVRHRLGSLVHVLRAQDGVHPAVQLVKIELAERVVLAQQDDQPFPVGLSSQPPRTARRGTGHSYRAGRTTTAVP